MSLFLENAGRLFRTAGNAAGLDATDISVVIRGDGSLHVVMEGGWTPEALAAHHGAETVYRVRRRQGQVRVEGRTLGERCVLETKPAAVIARHLLSGMPRYRLASSTPAAA